MNQVVAEALALCGVIDGHNDLPWASREERGYGTDGLDSSVAGLQTDVPRLRAGGVQGQFWSVYVPSDLEGAAAVQATLEQIDFVYRLVGEHPQHFALARTAAEVEQAQGEGRIASLLGAEGGHSLNDSPGVLRMFARLGVRYLTLTHFANTTWADSATDTPVHGGLSERGVQYVREMNRLGMLVDLSHVSHATMHQALDVSTAPVIFSHSSCTALSSSVRNVPDDVIARLPENGGVQMVSFVSSFLSQEAADWWYTDRSSPEPLPTIEQAADHVEHVRSVAGLAHVGLGGDYDGAPTFPAGMEDVSGYPKLLEELARRGWTASDLADLCGRNVLRVLRQTDEAFLSASGGRFL
ncbi:dipeptidase [Kineosporia rhizophila]|uniref:dipeptidase n=1 Tax=Kineosporia TaxID=49184 RepID=UPI001E415730|nr:MULTISPECIES: dipeptidase [Kineosporia]MCE0539466.1 dipeptidase [Kineosporia rhizophila]GLY18467.1 membrane dipeptidase [Kineosporia sp. NBRC 101677]